MLKRTTAALLLAGFMIPAAGVLTATQLNAQTPPTPVRLQRGAGGPREVMAERWLEDLNLSEEQRTQIRAIREGNQAEMQALHDQLRAEREAMHTLMASDATEAELRSQHDKLQTLHQEVADQRFENMLAVRAVLTPEQRAKLGDLLEERRETRRERRESRRENRGQGPFNRGTVQ